ncbi:MAG: type II toxin-antitoxin system RelE/ParE family toxin [Burkholderiales bacterium]|jgi:plasmid stabilization system protein ParE|nr:type II toxin-antitoxin system RelE/ParE family toxin [Burkholderiales bacterium]
MTKVKRAYGIEWRPKASEDLLAIIRYIGKDNPVTACRFGQEMRNRISLLAQHPELGHTGRPGLPGDVRELVVHRNYIVFYRVLNETHTVEILRVKHAAQQMP